MSSVQVAPMNPAVQKASETFMAMQTWPHWHEIALGAQKEYGMSEQEFALLLPEYQRFMALSAAFPGLGMLGPRVDVLWHSHILNTIRYREFNEQYIGRTINHLPCSSYELYGLSLRDASGICNEPPATCEDPWPAPPDPSPIPPDPEPELNPIQHAQMRQAILDASPRFVTAYTQTFGCPPPLEFWPRAALVEAIAQ